MNNKVIRYIALIVILGVIAGVILYLESKKPEVVKTTNSEIVLDSNKNSNLPKAQEISTPDGFINVKDITIKDNIGKKIILVDFWTYSCINCQRTLPYLNSWHQKYSDKGLLIIGIHTPEFDFEKDYNNVKAAVDKFGVKYPVVLDNDYSTWYAYKNRYWPRKYIIDLDGNIVYDHIGEGAYEETEKVIQKLLADRAKKLGVNVDVNMVIEKPAGAEEIGTVKSPEIYFGISRNKWLANGKATLGKQTFSEPQKIELNKLYLVGDWELTGEYAISKSKGAKIIFKYEADKVHFVASSDSTNKVQVKQDGATANSVAGDDVSGGYVTIKNDDLYRILDNGGKDGVHTLELIIENPGLKAFTFTFG